MSNAGEGGGGGAGTSALSAALAVAVRPQRLPRWTRPEILVLIEGKKAIESRGRVRGGTARSDMGLGPPQEPKWASVSAFCRRRGVIRGPVQCRKRWSNLAGDYKKIKEWERSKGEHESFWDMRNDVRREKRLPGYFDREVFEILEGTAATGAVDVEAEPEEEATEKVFDSGRAAQDDDLFDDDDDEETEGDVGGSGGGHGDAAAPPMPVLPPDPTSASLLIAGPSKDQQAPHNAEKGAPSQEGQKRRRTSEEDSNDTDLHSKLIEVLDRNSRMVAAQLEAQNLNCQLDREQRKDLANSLIGVLSKFADALGRIADKL